MGRALGEIFPYALGATVSVIVLAGGKNYSSGSRPTPSRC